MLRLRWRETHLACLWYLCGRFGRLQPCLRSSFSWPLHGLPIGAKFGSWFSVKPDYRVGRGKKTYSSDHVSTAFIVISNYLHAEARYRTMICCHFSWVWCDFPAVDRWTKLYFFGVGILQVNDIGVFTLAKPWSVCMIKISLAIFLRKETVF